MSLTRKRNLAAVAAVTVIAGIGAAGFAAAGGNGSGAGSGDDANEQEPSYVGSVSAPAESSTEQDDQQEEAALVKLATLSASDAQAAAGQAVAGKVGAAEIEEENGYVVYGVEVTSSNGDITDVKVDAGNGKILAQENEGPEDSADDQGAESESGSESD